MISCPARMNDHDAAIVAFWSWWSTVRPAFEQAITDGEFASLPDDASARVAAIHEDLQWEMGSGHRAEHFFALSPNGNPALRKITERWKACAPAEDDTWEFWPSRPAMPTATITWADQPLHLDECIFAWERDPTREVLHVQIFHPSFPQLSKTDRESAAVLLLDAALGEDDVERWVGGIEPLKKAPVATRSYADFVVALEELVASATDGVLVTLEGSDEEGRPLEVVFNAALKRINHLTLDLYVQVTLPLVEPTAEGLASPGETDRLQALEDALEEQLGDTGAVLGHETVAGKRVIHLFAEDTALIEAWAKEHRADVRTQHDEAWDAAYQWATE
jgi:hypothetical protein